MGAFLNDWLTPDGRTFRWRNVRIFFALGLIAFGGGLFAPVLRAQSARPAAGPPNRFLCIYDISAPMHRQLAAVQKATREVLESRGSGQLHYGDSLGVWSFDEELHAGFFPLQVWTEGQEDETFLRIVQFLKEQPSRKGSRVDKVMDGVAEVIKGPQVTTIILFSTGKSPMQGTPFDGEINDAYQRALNDMKRDPMPIVTVLQARNGKFLKYTVNALPWPVVIPELPIAIKNVAAARVEKTEPQTPPPTVAPKASEPPPVAVVTPPPTPAPAPVPAPLAAPATSVPPPTPAAVVPKAEVVQSPVVTPAPPPVVRAQPAKPQEQAALVMNPPARPLPDPPVRRGPQPAIPALAPTKPNTVPVPPPKAPEPAEPVQVKPPVVATPKSANPEFAKMTASPQNSNSPSAPAGAPKAKPNPTPIQTAVAVPVVAGRSKILLIAGVTLLIAALALLFMTLRRLRGAGEPSLITRSINNLRK